jgi:hypothetical protein
MNEEKRVCRNPNHPFKQKWYRFIPKYDDPNLCTSCASKLNMVRTMFRATVACLRESETLYGEKIIHVNNNQFETILKEVLNEQ